MRTLFLNVEKDTGAWQFLICGKMERRICNSNFVIKCNTVLERLNAVFQAFISYKCFQMCREDVGDDTTDDNIEKVKKNNCGRSPNHYYGHETCSSKVCSEIDEFQLKAMLNIDCSGVAK